MQIYIVSHCYSYIGMSLSVVGIDITRISSWYSNAMKECTSVTKPSEFTIIYFPQHQPVMNANSIAHCFGTNVCNYIKYTIHECTVNK